MTERLDVQSTNERKERLESFEFGSLTLASSLHPNRNEDAYLESPGLGLGVICDGMGGHDVGEVAARVAVETIEAQISKWTKLDDDEATDEIVSDSLRLVIKAAHKAVVNLGEKLNKRENSPGTTATVVVLHNRSDGRKVAYIANVGDSRVYIFHTDGQVLEQVTEDHDLMDDSQVRQQWAEFFHREITDMDITRIRKHLSECESEDELKDSLERAMFKQRNVITSALGSVTRPLRIQTRMKELHSGDKIVLTSDGIHDNLSLGRLQAEIVENKSANKLAESLVFAAREYADSKTSRSKKDDMTAVVILVS